MTTRITGLVSGLDVDALVEAGTSFYQGKLDEAKQKQQKLQWEQAAYKSIATDATTFYNKYLDIASDDCITKSSNWNTNKYTSSNPNAVTAESVGSTNVANYTANVTQLATAAKAEVSTNVLKPKTPSQITINNTTYTLNPADADNNAIVSDLNSQLSKAGQAVTVSYSDFANNGAGGFVIQNNVNGDKSLTVSAGSTAINVTKGTYLNATITCGSNTYTIDDSKAVTDNNVTLDNIKFTFNDVTSTMKSSTTNTAISKNTTLSNGTTMDTASDGSKVIKTSDGTTNIQIDSDGTTVASAIINGTTVSGLTASYSNGVTTIKDSNGVTQFSFDAAEPNAVTTTNYTDTSSNKIIASRIATVASNGIDATVAYKYDPINGVTSSTPALSSGSVSESSNGTISISNTDGSTTRINSDGTVSTSTIQSSNPASITGSSDVSDIQDKIESFVNDYNTLLSEINKQYYDSYDNDYQPLTDAQKKSMSDSDISAWNTKAQTGLLNGDDNLDRLASQMKDAMSTFMKSSGVDLESFGIKPVGDYSTQNGTYTVDSATLQTALEDPTKFSKIQSLFCDGITNISSYSTSNSSTDGIAARLKVALNNNVTTPTSIFSDLCGTDSNPASLTTNEFYKELQDQSDVITQYQNELSDQENALYEKYSQLETQLSEMQSSSSMFSSSSK